VIGDFRPWDVLSHLVAFDVLVDSVLSKAISGVRLWANLAAVILNHSHVALNYMLSFRDTVIRLIF